MNIEIRSHYWPNTPFIREIKVFINSVEIDSTFMTKDEIFQLAKCLRHLDQDLMTIADRIED